MATLYSATRVATGDGRWLADAGVLVDGGTIAAVGPVGELVAGAPRRHHVDGLVLPGLVDAATLVELADLTDAPTAPDPAVALSRGGGAATPPDTPEGWSDERRQRSARRGAQQLLRGGVGLAVDHVRAGSGVPALSRAELPGDSLVDVGAVSDAEADDVAAAVRTALRRRAPGRRVGVAVAAAPDPTPVAALTTVTAAAGDAPLRVVTRPGQPLDAEALAHAGALRPGTSVGPNPVVDRDGAARLARAGVVVLVVPAGADPPDLAVLADAGVAVVLGGGLTAAPDPLAAAAAFARLAGAAGMSGWPGVDGGSAHAAALALVTGHGARLLGWPATAGVLAAGRRADLVALDAPEAPDADADADGAAALACAAAGRQVLTVIGGVQRARRRGADVAWPPIDRQGWRDT